MIANKYDEKGVIINLIKKNCRINHTDQRRKFRGKWVEPKSIDISNGKNIGGGTWGRLDFMEKQCGYKIVNLKNENHESKNYVSKNSYGRNR